MSLRPPSSPRRRARIVILVPSPSHCTSNTTGMVQYVMLHVQLQVRCAALPLTITPFTRIDLIIANRHALEVVVAAIKDLWNSTLEYFREALNESWENAEQMFAAFDK